MLHLYAALAEKERAMISRRTKDALAALRTRNLDPCPFAWCTRREDIRSQARETIFTSP